MRKPMFTNITTSFVSLLSSFVVVAIAGFVFFSGYSPLVTKASAQVLDSGVACTTKADCVNSGGGSCINGTCGVAATINTTSKTGVEKTPKQFAKEVGDQERSGKANLSGFGFENFQVIQGSILCSIVACPDTDGTLLTQDLTSSMGNMIGYMFTSQPASTYVAVADFLDTAGVPIAQPVYAQDSLAGLGFAALSPILNAWKTFRNIAFLFFVIIILVIGFMIMFRQKVGQTAVTAQQAIPRVIIALLTVSFSYAIAGLLIDAMYILMTLTIFVFGLGDQQSVFLGENALGLGWKLVTSGATESFTAIQALIDGISPVNLGEGFLGGLTVGVIVAIAIVFAMFRLFFELLKTYVTIIISITIAPLLLMLGAIPGRDVFGGWLKGLVGNLAAFPIVLLVLILYDQLTGGLSQTAESAGVIRTEVLQGGFSPPYLFGTIEPGGIAQFFIGMGLLLIMTDLVKQGKKALGADEGVFGQFATAFGDSLKKGWTGGELIPGLAISDTRKFPGGGISGKNILSKTFRGTEETRKQSEKEGWEGRFSRYTGGMGVIGTGQYLFNKRAAGKVQERSTVPPRRDVKLPEGVTPKEVEKSPKVGIDS